MRRRTRLGLTAAAGLAAAALAACEPIAHTHGYAPPPEALAQIQPGVDSVATVTQKIGRPSTGGVIRDDTWYYVASKTETWAYNPPEVVDRRVVAVSYDDSGLVRDVNTYGLEDGRIINLVTRTTPTYGRELTILQQVFGNLTNVGGALNDLQTE